MPKLNFSRTVPYKPDQMLALVSDMASYPDFVPNCSAMKISNAEGDPVYQCNATMHMSFGPISQSYTSQVTLDREAMSVVSRAGDGLFSHLVSHWRFFPEGEGTRIQLQIDFEIANPVIRAVLDPAFGAKQGEILDAFLAEAKRRYS